MTTLALLCLVLAALCFFLATIGAWEPRVNLIALGLFLWVLPQALAALKALG